MNLNLGDLVRRILEQLTASTEETLEQATNNGQDVSGLVIDLYEKFNQRVKPLIEQGKYKEAYSELLPISDTARAHGPEITPYSGGLNTIISYGLLLKYLNPENKEFGNKPQIEHFMEELMMYNRQLQMSIKSGNLIDKPRPQPNYSH
ncbi:MAG TPA: hypothetical protein VJI97_01925 [Candidatus Nanoarchaeia archaeon]|nr:hypothetical protein [Candidatus Nanoarchaeia archaeon]